MILVTLVGRCLGDLEPLICICSLWVSEQPKQVGNSCLADLELDPSKAAVSINAACAMQSHLKNIHALCVARKEVHTFVE